MAATFTIQDITNPDLTYEERARLRKERREKKVGSMDAGRSSPSRPFRTYSPSLELSLAPTLGYSSEYAYISNMNTSPSLSPNPSSKQLYPFDNTRNRAVSEPVEFSYHETTVEKKDDNKNDTGFPQHTTTVYASDSRTPRLTRDATKKSNVVYRRDLDDFNKHDITVVMFPRDDTLKRPHDTKPQHETISDENNPTVNKSYKKGMMIVPSITTDVKIEIENEPADKVNKRKLSKTFSFLGKKDKGEKKKSPKSKRKNSTSARTLSSNGLSGISMPNLYSPDSKDSSESPETPTPKSKNHSIFRRKHDKKSNMQRTSWTFQESIPETVLQPAISLQNITESPTDLPTYNMAIKTSSMELLSAAQFDDTPVTMFESLNLSDNDDELQILSNDINRTQSPLSIGSISIDIPDLFDTRLQTNTPQPTLTDNEVLKTTEKMMKDQTDGGTVTENDKKEKKENGKKEETENGKKEETEIDDTDTSFSRNFGSRKPLRKQSVNDTDSPTGNKTRFSSASETLEASTSSLSVSPSRLSMNSNGSHSGSPRTTPTISRKNIPKSPTGSIKNNDKTPINTPKGSPRSSSIKRKSSNNTKTTGTKSPLAKPTSPLVTPTSSPKLKRSIATTSSTKQSPQTVRKLQNISLKMKTDESQKTKDTKKLTHQQEKHQEGPQQKQQQQQDSPLTRRRRTGIVSVTSPLCEEKKLNIGDGSKIIPKRHAPPPPDKKLSDLNSNEVMNIRATDEKTSSPITQRKNNSTGRLSTYVYESRSKKNSNSTQTTPNKETKTYKYSTGSLGKKSSLPLGTGLDRKTSVPIQNKKSSLVDNESKRLSQTQNSFRQSTVKPSSTSSLNTSTRKLSLFETRTNKQSPKIIKNSIDDNDLSTLDTLQPLGSILSSSTDKLSKGSLSPPFDSMFARPFSPISPQLSQEEDGDISLTPEVPLDQEDQLTFVYRSTLLRKSSNESNNFSRSISNKSLGTERKSFSRTSSPRKSSMTLQISPIRQSKRFSTGSPARKSSLNLSSSSLRKSSNTLSRKSSSGTTRNSVEGIQNGSATMHRMSTSQTSVYYSMRRNSSKSSLIPSSTLTRQSLRNAKLSADSITTKKPPSGIRASKRSQPTLTDSTDGTKGSDSNTNNIVYSKPKAIVKANSSAGFIEKSSNIRKSLKGSKSVDSPPKPKLVETRSAFLKPPSGSTLGRSSTRKKSSNVENNTFQNARTSVRMSRRTSSGTIKKVSQSNSPLHSANKTSPVHRTLKRTQKDDTDEAFEYISSMADKTKLSSVADHKRQVRPRTKHRPSPGHLQMLSQRTDISSELDTTKSIDDGGFDPNAYSTYMGKKKLDKTALAGLAAKLDFTTVQLRKTGIVEQMMSDKNNSGNKNRVIDDIQNSYGVQVTSHPLMLIMIKGRKNLQTRLVEPTAVSINSNDVFILVSDKELYLWQGKEANVIEKARANDIVNRIYQKRELGCRSNNYIHLDDEGDKKDIPRKQQQFWELLKGKSNNRKDIIITDESYERGMTSATKVYQYMVEGDNGRFVPVHEDTTQPLKISILDAKKILLFDFCSEVYVWMGKRCPQSYRKPSMIKARKIYDGGHIPPVFSNISTPKKTTQSPSRQSRVHSKIHQRHATLSGGSIRRKTLERRPSKGELHDRPSWSLFARVNEGSETILFREKFVDWPEPGRIIKMRGHESSGEIVKPPPMPELQPADVQLMVQPQPVFQGMRLEGENIHRGHGNYKVSRSTFSCNRVRSQKLQKYLVKDSDNILLPDQSHGLFYSSEGYVLRWSFIITIVRELEGLTPGEGMFAQDRKYQKQKLLNGQGNDNSNKSSKQINDDDSSDDEVNESDDESKRVLESGGRDRVAYFFWQGETASVNEKGAAAVITVEMDKERAPQIRVTQGKEHPTFLQLFKGTMIILNGRSDNNSIDQCPSRGYRLYSVFGNAKKEACLVEIDVKNHPLYYYTRSRGCCILQYKPSSIIYIWIGSKATDVLKGVASLAARNLKRRINSYKVVKVFEGSEPNELSKLMGNRTLYHSSLNVQNPITYTPRLFHLSSSTGWFISTEEIHVSKPDSNDIPDPFPFLQEDIYNSTQPSLYLIDADNDIYIWMGWWPVQTNKLLQEKNAFSGLAQSRWAKDKKLALETGLNYAKACKRTPSPVVYVVTAGTEHVEFTNLFPIWNERNDVQEIVGKSIQSRSLAEKELAKYNKEFYTLQELLKRPEEVDPSKLDMYLSDEDFEKAFQVSREKFSKMLIWKQVDLKKKVGLF